VINAARRVTGSEIAFQVAPRRAGDPPVLVGDAKKAREVLGWKPHYPELDLIIESAWEWRQRNPNGYR
jgi:UDP-glucose 4-epimerase